MKPLPHGPTVFEEINARKLLPHQVAKTFVPPNHFGRLLSRPNTSIIGPRGSGKTTLLKMLQGPALEAWVHPDADQYRQAIDFTGVFVATDVSWSAQIECLGEAEQLKTEHRRILGNAAFTTHVLHALVTAFEYRVYPPAAENLTPHRRVPMVPADESTMVREIADAWKLTIRVPSLLALKEALTKRSGTIKEVTSILATLEPEHRARRIGEETFLHIDFLSAAAFAVEVFENIAKCGPEKWALLFDELELAPRWIRDLLIKSLRNSNDHFILKLSMSLYSDELRFLTGEHAPEPGHDYIPVELWYPNKKDGYPFSVALFSAMLAQRGSEPIPPETFFGVSEFETPVEEWRSSGTAYMLNSKAQKRISDLAIKDESFRKYLADRGIQVDKLSELDPTQRAQHIRKIASIVTVREAFLTHLSVKSDTRVQKRSRKNVKLYSGASTLFAMLEGNPRLFIGVIGPLIDEYFKTGEKVTRARQNQELTKATSFFRILLKNIPCPPVKIGSKTRGLLSILDDIGKYFQSSVLGVEFNPEPHATFIVDSHTGDTLIAALGRALNAGAIVYIPDEKGELIINDLRGKRFRLNYLLAAHYQLPLLLGEDISLSTILKTRTPSPLLQEAEPE